MASKRDDTNRRAGKVDPSGSGMRTGNPQFEAHEGDEVRSSPAGASRRD
jgi:hypothetical protein